MQKKPQVVEAVMFFNEGGIGKEMLFPEFEAVLDGVVNLPELADRQVRLAHVLINGRLQVLSCVFFYLDFDESGAADPGWNLPLRRLADRGEAGPDLGAGPIRMVCRRQCPVPWHQMHLWDPEPNDLLALRDTVRRNPLGLLCEEALQSPVVDRVSAMDAVSSRVGRELRDEQRLKTARLIRQQRQHIHELGGRHAQELARLQQAATEQGRCAQAELEKRSTALREQRAHSAALEARLQETLEGLERTRMELTRLAVLEEAGRNERVTMREQFQAEMETRVSELQKQVALRDDELRAGDEERSELLAQIARLEGELERQATRGVEQALGQLAQLGMAFVVYHPGAGHLTIPLQDIERYLANPMAYVAAKCFVGEEQYRRWLSHFQQPTCEAALSSGGRCALPIDRVDSPGRFVSGESNYCARHRQSNRLRITG